MRKIAFALCMVVVLSSFLVGTAYAEKSGPNASANGGGQIYWGPPGAQAYTVAGTVGKTSDGNCRGNMVLIDRYNDAIWRLNSFDSLDIDGNVATFTGTATAKKFDLSVEVIFIITDNGEPGVGMDELLVCSTDGCSAGVISAGNFQVHSK